jgi:hypothetical protein
MSQNGRPLMFTKKVLQPTEAWEGGIGDNRTVLFCWPAAGWFESQIPLIVAPEMAVLENR